MVQSFVLINKIIDNPELWGEEKDESSIVNSLNIAELVQNVIIHVCGKRFASECSFEVNYKFSNDDEIRLYNKEFLDKDSATDIISFPSSNLQDIPWEKAFNKEGRSKNSDKVSPIFLGDVIVSYQTVYNYCKSNNISLQSRLIHLIYHSVLHLLGFDHVEVEDAEVMQDIEIALLKQYHNIDNPYI